MNTKNTIFLITGLLAGLVTATTVTVFADGDPTTDTVPRAIPYQGVLELNGHPVHATGDQAIWVEFALYSSPVSETPVYTQRIALEVYSGRFTATIGPLGDDGTPIEEVIRAADDLMLGMTLLGEELDDPSDDVAMTNRQRIMASPYAMWSTSATNLTVANNLTVGGDVTLGGNLNLGDGEIEQVSALDVAVLNDDRQLTTVGGGLAVNGSDIQLGLDDGRSTGSRTLQRAVVHDNGDTLALNYQGDFEGGTRVDGDLTVTGSLNSASGSISEPNYHITHTQQGWTVDLDMNRVSALCGDGDGCTVRIGMRRWSSNNDTATASRMFNFWYNTADRRWRASNDSQGRVGDGARTHAINVWDTCYLTDGRYQSYSDRGDNGTGLKLLLWNGYGGPNRSCELTFVD